MLWFCQALPLQVVDPDDLLDGIVTGEEAMVLFNLRTPCDYLLGNAELCWVQVLLEFCCVEAKGLGRLTRRDSY